MSSHASPSPHTLPPTIQSYIIIEQIFNNFSNAQFLCKKDASGPFPQHYILTKYPKSISLQKSVSTRIESLLFLQEKELIHVYECFFSEQEEFCVVERLDEGVISLRQYLFEKRSIEKLVHAFSDILHTLKILHAIDQVYGTLNCMNILVDTRDADKLKLVLRPFFVDLPLLRMKPRSSTGTSSLNEQRYNALLQKKRSLSYNQLHNVEDPYSFSLNEDNKLSIMQFQENWIWYEAPENVFLMTKLNLTKDIDIWALGCILVEMHIKHPLFSATSIEDQIINTIHIMGYPQKDHIRGLNQLGFYDYVSNNDKMVTKSLAQLRETFLHLIENGPLAEAPHRGEVADLAARLLNYDASQRFTISQIIQHPLFQIDEEDIIRIIHRQSATKTPLFREESSTIDELPPTPLIEVATPMFMDMRGKGKESSGSGEVPTVRKPQMEVETVTPVVNTAKRKESPAAVPTVTFKRRSPRNDSSDRIPKSVRTSTVNSTINNIAQFDSSPDPNTTLPEHALTQQLSPLSHRHPPSLNIESPASSAQSTPLRKTHASRRSSVSPSVVSNQSGHIRTEEEPVPRKKPEVIVHSPARSDKRVDETISSIGSLSIRRKDASTKKIIPSFSVHVTEPTNTNNVSQKKSSAKRALYTQSRMPEDSPLSPMMHSSPSISTPGAFPFHTPYHATPRNEKITATSPNHHDLSWITEEESIVPDSGQKPAVTVAPGVAKRSITGSEQAADDTSAVETKRVAGRSPQRKHSQHTVDRRSNSPKVASPPEKVRSPELSPQNDVLTLSPKMSTSFHDDGPVSTLSQSDTSSVEESLMLVSLLNDCKFDLKELTKRLLNQSNAMISPQKSQHRTPNSSRKKRSKPTLQLVNGRSPHRTLQKHKRQHQVEVVKKRPPQSDDEEQAISESLTVYSSDSTILSYPETDDSAPQDKDQLRRSLHRVKKQLKYLRKSNQKHARLLKKVSHVISPGASVQSPLPSPRSDATPRLAMLQNRAREQRKKLDAYRKKEPQRATSRTAPTQHHNTSVQVTPSKNVREESVIVLNATPDITNYYDGSVHYREIDNSSTHSAVEDAHERKQSSKISTSSAPTAKHLSILIDAMKGIPSQARFYLFRWEHKDLKVEIPVKRQFEERILNRVPKFVEQKFYIKIGGILPKGHALWNAPLHIDLYGNAQDIASRTNKMATCAVDLYLLSLCMEQEFYEINGWYHVHSARDGSMLGQMQVRCSLSSEYHSSRQKSRLTAYEGVLSTVSNTSSTLGQNSAVDHSSSVADQKVSSILRETQASFDETHSNRSDRSMNFEDVWKTLSGFDENLLGKHFFSGGVSNPTLARHKHSSTTGYESSGETKQLESTLEDLKRMSGSLTRGAF